MNRTLTTLCDTPISRRELLRGAGLLTAGLAAGCTPARLILDRHPAPFGSDSERTDEVLWAFVDTVAPGAPARAPGSIQAFADPFYPFAPYRDFFAGDLCRRSKALFGSEDFEALSAKQRERVVEDGLSGDMVARRLYGGAIFLAHVSVYGGISNDGGATPAIRFDGANEGFTGSETSYPSPARFLAAESTPDGNPA